MGSVRGEHEQLALPTHRAAIQSGTGNVAPRRQQSAVRQLHQAGGDMLKISPRRKQMSSSSSVPTQDKASEY